MAHAIPEKWQKYVMTDLPKMVPVAGHHKAAPFWVTADMFAGVNLHVAGMDVSKIVNAPHADPHVHESPEIYVTPSEKGGEVIVEIQMDQAKFEIESPFAIFIPPGVKHCFRVLKCESPHYIWGIILPDWQKP